MWREILEKRKEKASKLILKKKKNWPKAKAKPEEDISCLLAIIMPTELIMFIAHAPTSETITADDFLSFSIYSSRIAKPIKMCKMDGQQYSIARRQIV